MRTLQVVIVVGLLAGCGAEAKGPDPSNPFHCGIALAYENGLAVRNGKPDLVRSLEPLLAWYGSQTATLPPQERSEAEGLMLMNGFKADSPLQKATVKACITAAFANPQFEAVLRTYR